MKQENSIYMRPTLTLMYLHGRPVIKEEFNDYYEQKYHHPISERKCADCPGNAVMIIHELSGKHGHWYWCGQCDIGG